MAARATETTKAPEFSDADFDAWDDEAEVAELEKLNETKYIIVEGQFVGRFGDGQIVKLPLKLKASMVADLNKQFDDPVEQFRHLLVTFAGEEVADAFDEQGLIPSAIMTEKYFRAIGRAQELAFPESKPSSS